MSNLRFNVIYGIVLAFFVIAGVLYAVHCYDRLDRSTFINEGHNTFNGVDNEDCYSTNDC